MEFNRTKGVEGAWGLKKHIVVPDVSEMLKRATPEEVCLAESMQVGLRHLQDAGYGQAEEGGAGDDDSKLDIEQQLAPWITTKNFINATANKAMLKLHGEGDPTGRGEAFSFLRVSMKDIFLRAGEEMATRLGSPSSLPSASRGLLTLASQRKWRTDPSPRIATTSRSSKKSTRRRSPGSGNSSSSRSATPSSRS